MARLHTRVLILTAAVGLGLTAAAQHAAAQGTAAKPPETVILKGNPAGGVKFDHKKHAGTDKSKCQTCHHASKPEKALKAPQQKCQDCHVGKTATPPMKTAARAAFHDPLAKKGVCADCHKAEAAKGNKKVPAKCADCHKKENV